MGKKTIIIFLICLLVILYFPSSPTKTSFTSVFRITEYPAAITRGTNGSSLTVNISFGDEEVEEWIQTLTQPYPLLFIDVDWAERFPETVRLIIEKNIPTGLLGHAGNAYDLKEELLVEQLSRYEEIFDEIPLWFRTVDESFPEPLRHLLWDAEINAVGSTIIWVGGDIPPTVAGEIISVPHHQEQRVFLPELSRLIESREFKSIEDVIFGTTVKVKKMPE